MSNQQQPSPEQLFVSQHEPEAKPPPLLETGVLHWIYSNLFSSLLNTVLTVLGLFVVIVSVAGFFAWAIQEGNWFAISFNFRSFMIGRYAPEFEWRTSLTTLFVALVAGMAVAIWIKQAARAAFGTIIAILIAIWVLPPFVTAIHDLPTWYTTAGTTPIESGSATEVSIPQIAFVGQAGEEVTLRLATDASANDQTLANLVGFIDKAANTLRNSAINRIDAIVEYNTLAETLRNHHDSEIPQLTASQVDRFQTELDDTVIAPQVVGFYDINQMAVSVQIWRATLDDETDEWTLTPLEPEPVILNGGNIASYTLPDDGWYVLEKVTAEDNVDGVALIEATGIYPLLQSGTFSQEEGGVVDTFKRMTDFYEWQQPLPEIDGEDTEFVGIIRSQYRGQRPFLDFHRTFVAPFFQRIAFHTTLVMAFGIIGYFLIVIGRMVSNDPKLPGRVASITLLASPVVIWVLISGFPREEAMTWLLVVGLVFVVSVLSYIGRTFGTVPGIPILVVLIAILYGLTFATVSPLQYGGLPSFIMLVIAPIVMIGAAWLGVSNHIEGEENKLPIVATALSALFFIVGFGLLLTAGDSLNDAWLLSPSDANEWDGLLLTMMLTIFGIIAAFPIGVSLALGRRSDLPAIKYLCTAYIELVRGSPFITVLFFMKIFIPLINESFNTIPAAHRALIAVIIFSAAYLAENVRGGLQSLPPGQNEAAKALGLSAWQATIYITLPQALRAVIPALVGQFISLFKDTSLVAIVSLIDLTGYVNTMVVQPEFIGTRQEGLLFISVIYFVFSYVMSYVSRLLEASGSGSTRRM